MTITTEAQLELCELKTDLLPAPLEYAILVPDALAAGSRILFFLHGGGGSRDFLAQSRGVLDRAWANGSLAPCLVVTPSVTRSFYMNFRDGSQRWEDALMGPLLDTLRERFELSDRGADLATTGPSMGGMGSLRLAFKHPDRFGAVASLEPGIEPSLTFAGIHMEDRFWRDDALFARIYGDPIDEDYWQANNPANIALADPARLTDSGLAIYLEAGDQDSFGLHRGTEYLHRVLFDVGISHEYRLVKGADHVGASLAGRFADALAFIGRTWNPPPPDPALEGLHTRIATWRNHVGLPTTPAPPPLPPTR